MPLKIYRILTVLALALLVLPARADVIGPEEKARITEQLNNQLKTAKTSADSIHIYYNIFDLQIDAARRMPPLQKIYDIASREHDYSTMLDALRNLTVAVSRRDPACDSLLQLYLRRTTMIPVSPEQRETQTFIELNRLQKKLMNMSEPERVASLKKKLVEFDSDDRVDVYRRIEILYTICMYLQDSTNSQLLLDYLMELDKIIENLPAQPGALRNGYYVMAAMACSAAGYHEKAVEFDRNLLSTIRIMEERYKNQGREYRKFAANYYTIYGRMLSNYQALSLNEVDSIYKRLQEMEATWPVLNATHEARQVREAYYHMAHGEYEQAIPYLKGAIENPLLDYRRFQLLRLLVEAAQRTTDGPLLLEAYNEYTPLLEQRSEATHTYRIIEYEILHNMNSLRASNANLEAQTLKSRQMTHRRTLAWALTAMLGVLAVLTVIYSAYRRQQKMTRRLTDTNRALMDERDNLQKTQLELIDARDKARRAELHKSDVISTLCHEITDPVEAIVGYSQLIVDSVDDKRRSSMERFMQIIESNARLVNTLVSDVIDAAELENAQVVLKNKMVTMSSLAQIAADSLRNRLQPGVIMDVEPLPGCDPEMTVDTDPMRVEQVLTNLISNAVKFTDKGRIRVLYGEKKDNGRPVFIIEDTGPGIPPDKMEQMFGRYEKLSYTTQGIGLGLHICRLVAGNLGAEVYFDPDYTDGTRVLFVLPKERRA